MDTSQMKKIEAMKRYKRSEVLHNFYFYLLTAFACSLLCCFTLNLPYLFSAARVLLFVCIQSLISMFLSSKLLFILGNLIIVVLIVDSRIFSSNSSVLTTDVYYKEYMKSSQTQTQGPANKMQEHNVAEDEEQCSEGATQVDTEEPEENIEPCDSGSHSDELNKRADDYIARVNRQRRLEVQLSLASMAYIPMETADECAEAILESVCRGDLYVTVPSWVKVLFAWKLLFPEIMDFADSLVIRFKPNSTHISLPSSQNLEPQGRVN